MRNSLAIALFGTLFALASMGFPNPASADPAGQTQTVDGMVVYLGLMPVDKIRQDQASYPKHSQSKFPSGDNVYHVMLVLFENPNGKRITDAVIDVTVGPLALAGTKKDLHPTVVAGALTYCNYFRISPSDSYVIQAEIHRANTARVTRARFVLDRGSM